MSDVHSDAFVFFGATGDLAYKKIFPALQAMAKRGHLDVPVIGVAKAGWKLEQLEARAKDSLEKHGGLDPAAFATLRGRLRYVDGDYQDPATFQAIRKELGAARRPAHYLAIPPVLFELVVEQLGKADCTNGARVIVEKPFGHDVASARELNRVLLGAFDETSIFRIDHYLGKRPVHHMLFFRFSNAFLEPFYIRAGKCLPVTCTEVVVRLRQPPTMFRSFELGPNYCRLRISPDVTIAIGANVIAPGEETRSQIAEMVGTQLPRADEMDAYERVLGDAMHGDATLFAREDYVEEAWRIVDPVLKAGTPVYEYEPGTWGPKEVESRVSPPGGSQNPTVNRICSSKRAPTPI